MIDVPLAIRTYLVAQPSLTALTGQRIWAERAVPPAGYVPAQGGAIAYRLRGGNVTYETLINPSVQFKCYGADEAVAQSVYRALVDVLHEPTGNRVFKQSLCEVLGQTLDEPDTGWVFVLTFFRFWL